MYRQNSHCMYINLRISLLFYCGNSVCLLLRIEEEQLVVPEVSQAAVLQEFGVGLSCR